MRNVGLPGRGRPDRFLPALLNEQQEIFAALQADQRRFEERAVGVG
jgi:hypothetical protein